MKQLELFNELTTSFNVFWRGIEGKLHETLVLNVRTHSEAIGLVEMELYETKEEFKAPVLAFIKGGLYA